MRLLRFNELFALFVIGLLIGLWPSTKVMAQSRIDAASNQLSSKLIQTLVIRTDAGIAQHGSIAGRDAGSKYARELFVEHVAKNLVKNPATNSFKDFLEQAVRKSGLGEEASLALRQAADTLTLPELEEMTTASLREAGLSPSLTAGQVARGILKQTIAKTTPWEKPVKILSNKRLRDGQFHQVTYPFGNQITGGPLEKFSQVLAKNWIQLAARHARAVRRPGWEGGKVTLELTSLLLENKPVESAQNGQTPVISEEEKTALDGVDVRSESGSDSLGERVKKDVSELAREGARKAPEIAK